MRLWRKRGAITPVTVRGMERAKAKVSVTAKGKVLKMVLVTALDADKFEARATGAAKPWAHVTVAAQAGAKPWVRAMVAAQVAGKPWAPVMAVLTAADAAGTGNACPLIRCLGCWDSGWGASPANR